MKKFFIVLMALFFSFEVKAADNVLNLYIYAEYIPDKVINQFSKESGVKVNVSTFESSEELYAKLRLTQGEGYDLIMITPEYMIKLKDDKMLQKFDRSKLPNFKNLRKDNLNYSYDPKNEYTVPFVWGTSSFAVNTKKVDLKNFTSLNDLSRPEFKGRIMLTDTARTVMSIGLQMNGYSVNDQNEEHIKKAYETLRDKVIPNVRAYGNESSTQALLNEEVDIAQCWDGLAYVANKEDPSIAYVHMKEGIVVWIDSFALLAKSKNPDAAHKFVDFVMRSNVGKEIAEAYEYAIANEEAWKLLPEEIKDSPIFNLTPEQRKNSEVELDVGNALGIYEKYWTMIRSGNK